jgi:excisionase family DNA binding protein
MGDGRTHAEREALPAALDVKDIQQILGIGRGQAYELVNSGQFHTVKVGRRIKVSKEVFTRWLEGTGGDAETGA